jgi:cobalt-zinc-cadmium efflux system membrane fusion protein
LPPSRWEASGVEVAPVGRSSFVETIRLTGRVSLNEDRIAHIYPMVEGAVDEVRVGLGQVVRANDLLVVVHSREIGEAKLDLYQARLQHEMALAKDKIQQEIAANTRELLDALREGESITAIEERFRNRSMGDYRERLLLAYSSYLKSQADVERLEGPADSGVISAKQLYAARANRNADQATFQARLEQIEYELRTSLLLSSQSLREAVTHVAVSSTNLRILGCGDDEINVIDPDRQGEAISHYMVRAPFDGTVISKDVALKEQVRPDTQILRIADLSTVWITADIYEQNVPLLNSLEGQQVRVRNDAWPDREFPAKIFYTGEIMDESTRTIALRATADNRDHLLKPGMFVNVEFQAESPQSELVVPLSAVQEYGGEHFVFVHRGGEEFQRRTVRLGKQNDDAAVILAGLAEGDAVAAAGGFVLKSLMLEDLMGEE